MDTVLAFTKGEAQWKDVLGKLYSNVVLSAEGRQFKKDAAYWLASQRTFLQEGEVRLLVTWYLSRRGSDTDNRLKAMLDLLQGVLYENDVQVGEIHVVRRYDKGHPRAVIVAEPDDGSTVLDPGAQFNYALEF